MARRARDDAKSLRERLVDVLRETLAAARPRRVGQPVRHGNLSQPRKRQRRHATMFSPGRQTSVTTRLPLARTSMLHAVPIWPVRPPVGAIHPSTPGPFSLTSHPFPRHCRRPDQHPKAPDAPSERASFQRKDVARNADTAHNPHAQTAGQEPFATGSSDGNALHRMSPPQPRSLISPGQLRCQLANGQSRVMLGEFERSTRQHGLIA